MDSNDLKNTVSSIVTTYGLGSADKLFLRTQILALESNLNRKPDDQEIEVLLIQLGIKKTENTTELINKRILDHEGNASTFNLSGMQQQASRELNTAEKLRRNTFTKNRKEGD